MKITKVESFLVKPMYVFVKVSTDEGIVGYGEASGSSTQDPGRMLPIAGAVQWLGEEITGEDPMNIEYLWQRMYLLMGNMAGGSGMRALSGIDAALLDIKGKALNTPVYNLIGGRCWDKIKLYTHPKRESPETIADDCAQVVKRGFTGIKFDPFTMVSPRDRPPYTEYVKYSMTCPDSVIQDAIVIIEAVRAAVGDRVDIAIEAHGKLDLESAIRFGRALEPYNIMWLEDAMGWHNASSYKTLRDHTRVPICAGERLMCPADFREFLELGAADVLNPDACWSGGITGLKKIANMAEQYYVPLAPHHSAGPLGQIIGAHLCVSIHNFKVMESFWSMLPDYEGLIEPNVTIKKGFLELPKGPGLGVSLNEEECMKRRHSGSRWEVRPKPTRPREFIW